VELASQLGCFLRRYFGGAVLTDENLASNEMEGYYCAARVPAGRMWPDSDLEL
jgi:hypothetical protein